jgi:hypothetical protein
LSSKSELAAFFMSFAEKYILDLNVNQMVKYASTYSFENWVSETNK